MQLSCIYWVKYVCRYEISEEKSLIVIEKNEGKKSLRLCYLLPQMHVKVSFENFLVEWVLKDERGYKKGEAGY